MTDISKTVVVLGATGQQGGSVAAARADGWAVRAVVRDPSAPRARSLSAAGVETVRGDLADPESLRSLTENMLNTDPPDHTRLRWLVNKAFTPRTVVRMRAPSSRSPVGRPTPWGTPARWI